MIRKGANPFDLRKAPRIIDCKKCGQWSEIAGRCRIEPGRPKPCGQRPQTPTHCDFGRSVLG